MRLLILAFLNFLLSLNSINCNLELNIREEIDQAYECDPACWFLEESINSTTIKKWPVNCTDVCGVMYFYENADLTVFELQQYFKNLKVLKGGIAFYNTLYASVEFLETLEEVYCDVLNTFSFGLNPNLEILNFGNLKNITCAFYAYNNTKLDATSFCEDYVDLTVFFVYNNYINCKGCVIQRLYTSTLDKIVGCTSLVNMLSLNYFYTDYDPPTDMSPFEQIQNITGCLEFSSTDLKNLSFFESLEIVRSNQYGNYDLNIEQCYNMTRMGFPALKNISTTRDFFLVNVDRAHPDFCFTTTEMKFFLDNNVKFAQLDAKICYDDIEKNVCVFDKMSSLQGNCTDILGNVLIGVGDEIYKDKLNNLMHVYGSLTIQNTNLTDLSFLRNLEYVALLNDSSIPFRVNGNKLLTNATLPRLKRVFSKSRYQIDFQDNGNSLLNSAACLNMMNNIFDTNVAFDGKECEVIDRAAQNEAYYQINKETCFLILLCFILFF